MAYFSPIAVSRLEKNYNPFVPSVSQANLPEAGKAGGENYSLIYLHSPAEAGVGPLAKLKVYCVN